MPNIQASGAPTSIAVNGLRVTAPNIINKLMVSANTEVAITLPANTARWTIKARGNARLQLAYVITESSTNYVTIYPGDERAVTQVDRASTILYVQSSKAGEIVEIESWV